MRFDLTLRDYQIDMIERVRACYREGAGAPLLQLPTGAGKTVTAGYMMASALDKGRSTLFLVHRVELIRQTSETLTAAGVPHGVIHPDYPSTRHRLQVASVQTVARRLHRVAAPDLIVIDEAHHTVATTWARIVNHFGNALLLGLTATPCRLDGRGLGTLAGGFFDRLVTGPSMSELIHGGFLAKPRIFASNEHLNLSSLRTRAGDYEREAASEMMGSAAIVGDAVAHYRAHLSGKRAIAFCTSVANADRYSRAFNDAGIPSSVIDGTMSTIERGRLIRDFTAGTIKVLTSCDLISEGFDVPACDGALLLRPTKSESLYLQQVGRALRVAPGKDSAVILDHAGCVKMHGLPQDNREWTLDGRVPREASEATVRCPTCFAMLPRGTQVCPECETVLADEEANGGDGTTRNRDREVVDGNLIELTPELMEEIRRRRRMEVHNANSREDFERIAAERGYRRGWVHIQMRLLDERRRRDGRH